jgi:hypothetical protein
MAEEILDLSLREVMKPQGASAKKVGSRKTLQVPDKRRSSERRVAALVTRGTIRVGGGGD